jgi:hypothetical protein
MKVCTHAREQKRNLLGVRLFSGDYCRGVCVWGVGGGGGGLPALATGTLDRAATALNLHVQTWLMVRARAGGRRRLAPTAFKWRRARSAFFSWRVAAILRLDGIPPLFDRARVPLARKATRRTLPSSDRIRSTHPSYRGWTRPH